MVFPACCSIFSTLYQRYCRPSRRPKPSRINNYRARKPVLCTRLHYVFNSTIHGRRRFSVCTEKEITVKHLTSGSSRSLCSLGLAKASPLTWTLYTLAGDNHQMTKRSFLSSAISSLLLTILGFWSTNCYCSTDCTNPYCETTFGPLAWYEISQDLGILNFATSFIAHLAIATTIVFQYLSSPKNYLYLNSHGVRVYNNALKSFASLAGTS